MAKPDKDMGTEVNNLGGYRPNTDRLQPSPGVSSRYVEIMIIAPSRAFGPPRPRRRPIISFGKSAFDF